MKKFLPLFVFAIMVLSLVSGIMTITSKEYKQNLQSISELDHSLSDLYSKKKELSSHNYGLYGGLMGLMMDSTYDTTSNTVNGLKGELQSQIDNLNKRAYMFFGISGLCGIVAIALYVKAKKE